MPGWISGDSHRRIADDESPVSDLASCRFTPQSVLLPLIAEGHRIDMVQFLKGNSTAKNRVASHSA
jgi:hypothetical protein